MYLFHNLTILQNTALFVWQNPPEMLFSLAQLPNSSQYAKELAQIKHQNRRDEWLTSRHLLWEIDGKQADFSLQKDSYGKPFIAHRPTPISLSHTANLTAIIRADMPCGIDIQVFTPQIMRIASKFMRHDEWRDLRQHDHNNTVLMHRYWSAKEAVYKAWGIKDLAFKDIYINADATKATVFKDQNAVAEYKIYYLSRDNYILVAAIGL
jgi:4'-phosphopantetheinyl transferase